LSTRVVALVEDRAASGAKIAGEHGLSLLIETDNRRVLFDAGASGLASRNADALGLGKAITRLYAVVLSHGHYDHVGGLAEILRRMRRSGRQQAGSMLPIFTGPAFFEVKVRRAGEGQEYIGPPLTRMEFEELGAWFIEKRGPAEVVPEFFVTGEIARREEWEESEGDLCIARRDGSVVQDPFQEEQALALRTGGGLAVFVGCAHRGLVNSIAAAQQATGEERVRAIFGGAHLHSATTKRIARTVEAVAQLEPELVALGHCTGSKAEERFAKALGERFQPLRTGASWVLA